MLQSHKYNCTKQQNNCLCIMKYVFTHIHYPFFEVLKVYLLVLSYFNNLPCNRILSWIEAQNNLEGKEDSQ